MIMNKMGKMEQGIAFKNIISEIKNKNVIKMVAQFYMLVVNKCVNTTM